MKIKTMFTLTCIASSMVASIFFFDFINPTKDVAKVKKYGNVFAVCADNHGDCDFILSLHKTKDDAKQEANYYNYKG